LAIVTPSKNEKVREQFSGGKSRDKRSGNLWLKLFLSHSFVNDYDAWREAKDTQLSTPKEQVRLPAVVLGWLAWILPGSQLVYNRSNLLVKIPEASTDHTA
jgi:hypothetical protein